MTTNFAYNARHQVLVCQACQTCLPPRPTGQLQHLRRRPHHLLGAALKATAARLASYDLRTEDELRQSQPAGGPPIPGLATYPGYQCLLRLPPPRPAHGDDDPGARCLYSTRRLQKMRDHVARHQRKPWEHTEASPLWQECLL